jgi:eukaryotic-like serine/threonine-protein kinase
MARRVRLIATTPLMPPDPPPTPQPLPSARMRVAELAGSMLWATPCAALASLMVGALMQVDLTRRPQDLGYLFAMTMVGSWTVLIANKISEEKEDNLTSRRVIQLIVGLVVGLIAAFLSNWMLVDPSAPSSPSQFVLFDHSYTPRVLPGLLGYAAYFGLVGLAVDWWTMTNRSRKSRFRFVPILKTGLFALIPSLLFFPPDTHPFAIPVVLLTSVVVQFASPWSEAAARYATYARANKKNASRVA